MDRKVAVLHVMGVYERALVLMGVVLPWVGGVSV